MYIFEQVLIPRGVHMGKRFRGVRLVKWGLSEETVARFQDFCEAKDRSPAYVQMENALKAYMDDASEEIKKQMASLRRKRRTNLDDVANSR